MTVGVFVPALMAVGLLVSGAIVIFDWVSALLPSRSAWRRQQIARDALGVVSRVAAASGVDVQTLPIRRRVQRDRIVYVGFFCLFGVLGMLLVQFGEDLYEEPIGLLHANPWSLAIGYGIGGTFLLVAVVSLIPALVTLQRGKVVRALVESTWLGKPAAPPDDPHDLLRTEGSSR